MTTPRQIRRDAFDLWRFCHVDGRLDELRTREVVNRLIESGRSRGPAVLAHFLRLLKLDRDRYTAQVGSATPLDDQTRASIERWLLDTYGVNIETNYVTEPKLLGGLRVKVGSKVYDGTIRAELDALEARL
jgi:F-type H+-transporting ATPase subunit delta